MKLSVYFNSFATASKISGFEQLLDILVACHVLSNIKKHKFSVTLKNIFETFHEGKSLVQIDKDQESNGNPLATHKFTSTKVLEKCEFALSVP